MPNGAGALRNKGAGKVNREVEAATSNDRLSLLPLGKLRAASGGGTLSFQGVGFTPTGGASTITESSNAYLLGIPADDDSSTAGFTNGSSPSIQDNNLLNLVTHTASNGSHDLTCGGGSTVPT